jgi:hypothetical protein
MWRRVVHQRFIDVSENEVPPYSESKIRQENNQMKQVAGRTLRCLQLDPKDGDICSFETWVPKLA